MCKMFLRNVCDICFLYRVCLSLPRVIVPSSHRPLSISKIFQIFEQEYQIAIFGTEIDFSIVRLLLLSETA
jgi:hypothetical protein